MPERVYVCEKCGDNVEVVIYKGDRVQMCANPKCGEIYS